jgi:predicted nucleic acid-binding protein
LTVTRPAAVLDANVLYPARLRDLFLRLAIAGLYRALWTERILDECFDNLLADRPDVPAEHLHRTRRLMTVAVPDAVVEDYDHLIDDLDLPDPDDRHVLAAAVAASAGLIVTGNLTDFPPAAIPAGITVLSPDAFVLRLIQADIDAVATVVDQQAGALRNPPMTTAELLAGLAIVGLRQSVDALRGAT